MTWEEARKNMIATWLGIREDLTAEDLEPLDLLSRINALNDFCQKAKEASGQSWGHCPNCMAYQQFGGCKEVSAEMSDRVAARDWEGLKTLVDGFIHNLETLVLPPEAAGATG